MTPQVAAPATLRWGVGERAFELRSTDPTVIERAAAVFRPWTLADAAPGGATSWTVTPVPEGWQVSRDEAPARQPSDIARKTAGRAVSIVEFRAVAALAEEPPEVLTFHAALVAVGDRGIMILGPNEAGKSTLSVALWRHGFGLLGDDVTVVEPGTAAACSAPRRVSLRTTSRELVGEDLWRRLHTSPAAEATADGYLFHPDEVDGRDRPGVVTLSACLFLARRSASVGNGLTRVPGADATLALVPYSNLIRRKDLGAVLAAVAPLASTVPMYDLGRAPLSTMVAAVERLASEER